jgi:transposase InsO family protein
VVGPRSTPSWRAFLDNHLKSLVSIDFFTVPTVRFRILFVFLVLSHDRRRIVHINVTEHPSAEWTGRQLVEAFPWDTVPRYLIRDRDGIYGQDFTRCVNALGIKQVLIAPRSPWQNAFAERFIREYMFHYHVERTHQDLDGTLIPPTDRHGAGGPLVRRERLGGLLDYYYREAAWNWDDSVRAHYGYRSCRNPSTTAW